MMKMDIGRLVAHRGQNETWPENTIEGIVAAIECGAKRVEFDVQMTSDHIPVVCHDQTLARTSNSTLDITRHRFAELETISVGEPRRFNDKYQHVLLPSLQDMVETLQRYPQVQAFVEFKQESINQFGIEAYIQPILDILQSMLSRCICISDNLESLLIARQRSDVRIGWIIHHWQQEDRDIARDKDLDYLVINHSYTKKVKHDFASDPWDWVMYHTHSLETAEKLFALGVAYVESNDICGLIISAREQGR